MTDDRRNRPESDPDQGHPDRHGPPDVRDLDAAASDALDAVAVDDATARLSPAEVERLEEFADVRSRLRDESDAPAPEVFDTMVAAAIAGAREGCGDDATASPHSPVQGTRPTPVTRHRFRTPAIAAAAAVVLVLGAVAFLAGNPGRGGDDAAQTATDDGGSAEAGSAETDRAEGDSSEAADPESQGGGPSTTGVVGTAGEGDAAVDEAAPGATDEAFAAEGPEQSSGGVETAPPPPQPSNPFAGARTTAVVRIR